MQIREINVSQQDPQHRQHRRPLPYEQAGYQYGQSTPPSQGQPGFPFGFTPMPEPAPRQRPGHQPDSVRAEALRKLGLFVVIVLTGALAFASGWLTKPAEPAQRVVPQACITALEQAETMAGGTAEAWRVTARLLTATATDNPDAMGRETEALEKLRTETIEPAAEAYTDNAKQCRAEQ